ncbi:Hypp9513 [Branchiostoma lanceolatum]|uniref:Hypp9513 protein n=1 Tax=Branchiostoma lanceolatum TaxID=7740 RepID=A0A8S4MN78_BRALA|nr:Hypp9513 [Branchiostoma lanceolatum]
MVAEEGAGSEASRALLSDYTVTPRPDQLRTRELPPLRTWSCRDAFLITPTAVCEHMCERGRTGSARAAGRKSDSGRRGRAARRAAPPVRRAHVRTRPGLEARERRGGNLIAGGAAVRRGRAARARAASTCANAAGTGSARAAGRKSDSGHGAPCARAARPCSSRPCGAAVQLGSNSGYVVKRLEGRQTTFEPRTSLV